MLDLENTLLNLGRGKVRVTTTGFVDDSGTEYIGKRLTNAEHEEQRLGSYKWIDLKDGTVFQITGTYLSNWVV